MNILKISFIFLIIISFGVFFKDNYYINLTKSAPIGLWKIIECDDLNKGDWVTVETGASKLAKKRKYITCKKLLKQIIASDGDHIRITSAKTFINQKKVPLLTPLHKDSMGEKLSIFFMDRKLDKEFFVAGISPRSFDSRYFGPVKKSQIIKVKSVLIFQE